MGTKYGTLKGVQLLDSRPATARKTYLCQLTFGSYANSDSGSFSGVGAAITTFVRDGKTRTLRSACGGLPGSDGTYDIYVGECTVSTADLTFNLVDSSSVELVSVSATTLPASVIVTVDES